MEEAVNNKTALKDAFKKWWQELCMALIPIKGIYEIWWFEQNHLIS